MRIILPASPRTADQSLEPSSQLINAQSPHPSSSLDPRSVAPRGGQWRGDGTNGVTLAGSHGVEGRVPTPGRDPATASIFPGWILPVPARTAPEINVPGWQGVAWHCAPASPLPSARTGKGSWPRLDFTPLQH